MKFNAGFFGVIVVFTIFRLDCGLASIDEDFEPLQSKIIAGPCENSNFQAFSYQSAGIRIAFNEQVLLVPFNGSTGDECTFKKTTSTVNTSSHIPQILLLRESPVGCYPEYASYLASQYGFSGIGFITTTYDQGQEDAYLWYSNDLAPGYVFELTFDRCEFQTETFWNVSLNLNSNLVIQSNFTTFPQWAQIMNVVASLFLCCIILQTQKLRTGRVEDEQDQALFKQDRDDCLLCMSKQTADSWLKVKLMLDCSYLSALTLAGCSMIHFLFDPWGFFHRFPLDVVLGLVTVENLATLVQLIFVCIWLLSCHDKINLCFQGLCIVFVLSILALIVGQVSIVIFIYAVQRSTPTHSPTFVLNGAVLGTEFLFVFVVSAVFALSKNRQHKVKIGIVLLLSFAIGCLFVVMASTYQKVSWKATFYMLANQMFLNKLVASLAIYTLHVGVDVENEETENQSLEHSVQDGGAMELK
jgi:Na+-transporting methylmalonyl-CoA/oxaloacetate decarboxylase gamma subunit